MTESRKVKRHRWVLYLTALTLLVFAGAGATMNGHRAKDRLQQDLLAATERLASALPVEEALSLSFSGSDVHSPEFLRIRSQLEAYSQQAGFLSISLCALRDGQILWGPSSLPNDHRLYAAPGTPCADATDVDRRTLLRSETSAQGPIETVFGTTAKATAPVIHPRTGDVLMMVSVLVDASSWNRQILAEQGVPVLIVLVPLLILLIGWGFASWRRKKALPIPRHTEAVFCALTCLALTAGISTLVWRIETASSDDAFLALSHRQTIAVQDSFQTLENDLTLIGGLFEASDHITQSEFSRFCGLLLNDTAIRGTGWIRKVPADQKKAFEQEGRLLSGHDNYHIWGHDSDGTNSPSAYYPILYVEPITDTSALGFDYASDSNRTALIQETHRSGLPAASKPLHLITDKYPQPAISLGRRVFSEQQQGMALLVFYPQQCLEVAIADSSAPQPHTHLELYELEPNQPPTYITCTGRDPSDAHEITSAQLIFPVFAFGKAYALTAEPTSTWRPIHAIHNTLTAALSGLTLSILLTWLIAAMAERPARLEELVRKRSVEVHQSEQRFRTLVESLPDLVWLKAPDGKYLLCNRRFEQFFGAPEAEILGKTDYDFVDEDLADFFKKHDQAAIKRESPTINEEKICFASDGHEELLETIKVPLHDEQNNLIGVLGIGRNITERQQTAADLEQSREQYETLLSNLPGMVFLCENDEHWTARFISDACTKLTGYTAEELTGDTPKISYSDLVHPDDAQRLHQEVQPYLDRNEHFEVEYRIITRDGTEKWVRGRGIGRTDESGHHLIEGFISDISQNKDAEKKIRFEQNLFHSLMEMLPVSVYFKDREGRFVNTNLLAAKNVGAQTPADLTGKTDSDFYPETAAQARRNLEMEILRTEQTAQLEERSFDKWVLTTKAPWYDENGKVAGTFGVSLDITERKEADAALEQRMNELQRFNKAMTGRELRMIELKKEINALCKQLGHEEPYQQHTQP